MQGIARRLAVLAAVLAPAPALAAPGPDTITCATLPPLETGTCEVTPGDASKLIVGTVLAPGTVYRGGQVAVDAGGTIQCVGCDCAGLVPDATEIRCPGGVVSPGLINTHDQITFAQNDPYVATVERYEHRHDWRLGLNGHTQISAVGGASADQVRWGELRFLLGGATSTVGSGGVAGWLRNLDRAANREGLTSLDVALDTFPLGDSGGAQLDSGCAYPDIQLASAIEAEDAYLPHVAEGIDAFARNEFLCTSATDFGGQDLLLAHTAIVHGIGLRAADYGRMAERGAALVWSPRSNLSLYGDTAVVTAAKRLGVTIALGTDWTRTGSMNLLRELRCADAWNAERLAGSFSDEELWLMVTRNAAQATATDDEIGILAAGRLADIAIFSDAAGADHRAVIDAEAEDVVLVMRGGEVLYGDAALVAAASASSCDALDVCGVAKSVCASGEIGKTLAELAASAGPIYGAFFCDEPPDEPLCFPSRAQSVGGSTVYTGIAMAGDPDGDGIPDASDVCPSVFDPIRPLDDGAQADEDLDGLGDACDPCPLEPGTTLCVPEPEAAACGLAAVAALSIRRRR